MLIYKCKYCNEEYPKVTFHNIANDLMGMSVFGKEYINSICEECAFKNWNNQIVKVLKGGPNDIKDYGK